MAILYYTTKMIVNGQLLAVYNRTSRLTAFERMKSHALGQTCSKNRCEKRVYVDGHRGRRRGRKRNTKRFD